jgi:hypothetical protein
LNAPINFVRSANQFRFQEGDWQTNVAGNERGLSFYSGFPNGILYDGLNANARLQNQPIRSPVPYLLIIIG